MDLREIVFILSLCSLMQLPNHNMANSTSIAKHIMPIANDKALKKAVVKFLSPDKGKAARPNN